MAIMIFGPGSQIQKNEITETTATVAESGATAVQVLGGPGCLID